SPHRASSSTGRLSLRWACASATGSRWSCAASTLGGTSTSLRIVTSALSPRTQLRGSATNRRTAGGPAVPWRRPDGSVGSSRREGARVNDLIDTTEMYLRTIYELEEEGILPLRARIAERLGQSGPT